MLYRIYRKLIHKHRDNTFNKIFSKFGLENVYHINTWTSKDELRTLYYHSCAIKPGGNALEIGSYLGASTCYIVAGLAAKNGHLTCVDTWNNETMPDGIRDTFAEFQKNTLPIRKYITTVRRNSFELTRQDFDRSFEFVFIDGDHSYEAVKRDFALVAEITSPAARVFFHDSVAYEGVTRVIGEALASGQWGIGGAVSNLFWVIKK